MSSYKEFLAEKEQIDRLVSSGYQIKGVKEGLSGALLEFEWKSQNQEKKKAKVIKEGEEGKEKKEGKEGEEKVYLQILTAEARKYFSSLIIRQRRQGKADY